MTAQELAQRAGAHAGNEGSILSAVCSTKLNASPQNTVEYISQTKTNIFKDCLFSPTGNGVYIIISIIHCTYMEYNICI